MGRVLGRENDLHSKFDFWLSGKCCALAAEPHSHAHFYTLVTTHLLPDVLLMVSHSLRPYSHHQAHMKTHLNENSIFELPANAGNGSRSPKMHQGYRGAAWRCTSGMGDALGSRTTPYTQNLIFRIPENAARPLVSVTSLHVPTPTPQRA